MKVCDVCKTEISGPDRGYSVTMSHHDVHDIQGVARAVNKIRHNPQRVPLFFKSSYLLNRVNIFLLRKQSPPPIEAICSPQLHYIKKE